MKTLAFALLLSSCALSAATVSYTVYPETATLVSFSGYPNATFVYPSVELPLFNPSLGTLTKVTIDSESLVAGSIPGGFGGITNYGYGNILFAGVNFGSIAGCGGGVSGANSFPDNSGLACREYNRSKSLASDGADFATPFYGTGKASLVWQDMYAEASIGSGYSMTVDLVKGSYRTVTYEYDSATPEPSTASLLLGSCGVLGFIVRRRRASR